MLSGRRVLWLIAVLFAVTGLLHLVPAAIRLEMILGGGLSRFGSVFYLDGDAESFGCDVQDGSTKIKSTSTNTLSVSPLMPIPAFSSPEAPGIRQSLLAKRVLFYHLSWPIFASGSFRSPA